MEPQKQSKVIQELVKNNFEFKQLHKEHESLDGKIEEISRKKFLSEKDEHERKELQKKKLIGRDRMEKILRAYQGQT